MASSHPQMLTEEQRQMQSIHGYPSSVVIQVQNLIDQANKGEIAPLTAYEDIWVILYDLHICKEAVLNVDDVACHPCNRERLGLNGYNVHRNGNEVDKVGVDLNELNKAACFELCPLEPKRSSQLQFNARLVQNSKGLLAELKGTESKLSVGTGHWTAWVRAIKSGCRSPFKNLTDSCGRLSTDRFCNKDHLMKKCIGIGWPWRIFPWQTEAAWPKLPDLAQRALNSSHSVSSRSTELEVMVWLADACNESDSSTDFQELVDAVALSGPSCATYVESVGELAKQIGSSPKLFFLDRFAKAYGESKQLGEEFVKAVVGVSVSKSEKVNYVRCALVATNLVAEKVTDGIARLIVKSDVDRLKGNEKKESTVQADTDIKTAWELASAALDAGSISQEDFDDIVGKLMVRIILHLCDKQKLGPESRIFKDIQEIKRSFCEELLHFAGESTVDLGDWAHLDKQSEVASDSSKPTPTPLMLSIEQQNDPSHIFAENGFVVGECVREKNVDTKGIYKITDAGEVVYLKLFDAFDQSEQASVKIPLKTFVERWVVHKGKLPQLLDAPTGLSQQIVNDELRSKAFQALVSHEKDRSSMTHLVFMLNPAGVVAKASIPKHTLKLAPLTIVSNLSSEKKQSSVLITIGGVSVYATQPPKPDKNEKLKEFTFAPFWWVEKTTIEEDANMKLVSVKVDDVSFPALQNIRALHKKEKLFLYKPKEVKPPLQGGEMVKAPPAKKLKKA